MSALSLRQGSLAAARAARPAARPAAAVLARRASSSATDAEADPAPVSNLPGGLPMPWSDYLAMRKRRKQWATFATVPSTIGGLFGGISYFANLEADPTQTIMGLEPMFVYGGGTWVAAATAWELVCWHPSVACMALGYLVGPSIGNALFSVTHPKLARGNPPPLEVMDREFYHRIRAKRADPSRQSVNNPAPDFYGEKIVSLGTYRRWLKDQEAYRRKAAHGVDGEEP